ncbi:MAG: serine aminopeptidase domain-containing protein [Lentisphaeria bacterium]|jgi:alpha-beta hydrolase superfamily lysophospholipase
MREQHGYLHLAGRSLHVGLCQPDHDQPDAVLVVCEPFGEEKRCAFRMLVRLSWQLAELGIATLRFDLSGTGDSSGVHGEATWQQWQAETTAALQTAPSLTGARQAVILGARAGALLAAPAAASSNAAAVILAEPILTGEDMVNDLERRQKIKDMMTGATSSEAEPPTEDAAERDFGGFVVSDTMLQQIRQADLVASLPDTAPIHVLRVSGAKKFPASWQPLLDRCQASSGTAAIIADKPFWGQLEYYESPLVNDAIANLLTGRNPA